MLHTLSMSSALKHFMIIVLLGMFGCYPGMYDSDNSYCSDDDDDDDDDDELDDEILQSIARSFRKKYERKPTEKGTEADIFPIPINICIGRQIVLSNSNHAFYWIVIIIVNHY